MPFVPPDLDEVALRAALRKVLLPERGGSPTTLRQVTSRCRVPHTSTTSHTSVLSRTWQVSYTPLRYVQIAVPNWYMASGIETLTGSAATVAVSIEYPAGTFTQLPFSGSATGTVADGDTGWTDLTDLGVNIPAFTRFWVWIWLSNPTRVPYSGFSKLADQGRGDATQFSAANNTMTGIITDGSLGINSYPPAAVLGYSDLTARASFGDSLTAGIDDLIYHPNGGVGQFGRGLARLGPHINFGVPGDTLQAFVTNSTRRRAIASTAGVAVGIDAYGVNDINLSRTSAQILTDRASMRALFSIPIYDITITPMTLSSDSFKTAANQSLQSVTKNTQRVTHNDAVRAGLSGSPGYIDVAQYVETSTTSEHGPVLNGGVWIPGFTIDGTHGSTRSYTLVSAVATDMFAIAG